MLILSTNTDLIQINLGGSPSTQLPFVASYRDVNTTDYTPGRVVGTTNNTTVVTAVGSPASGYQRVVDFINIRNPNVANATVSVFLNVSATQYLLFSVTLAQNEVLQYQDGSGFKVFTDAGAIKTSLNQGTNVVASGDSVVMLSADVINNNATANTIQDVTGLSFPVNSGSRYWFQFCIRYTSAATATGSRWTVNGPTNTELVYDSVYGLTLTTETVNHGQTTYDLPAASNASSPSTAGNMAWVEGIILPSANGTVIARFASEVLSSAITAKAGSFVRYRQLS